MNSETENIQKLPKWAQRRIHALESQLAAKLEELRKVGAKEGPIVWEPYEEKVTLPDGTIQFTVRGKRIHVMVRRGPAGEFLEVSTIDGSLISDPRASNVIYVIEEPGGRL